jgi:hypothetical protein
MTQKEAALLRKWIDFMYINIIRVSAAFTEVEGRIYIKYRSKEAAESMPEVYGEGEGPNLDNRITKRLECTTQYIKQMDSHKNFVRSACLHPFHQQQKAYDSWVNIHFTSRFNHLCWLFL